FALVVEAHTTGQVDRVGKRKPAQHFNIVADFSDLFAECVGHGLPVVLLDLGGQDLHARLRVCLRCVRVHKVFVDVKFVGGGEGTLFHQVEDFLRVDNALSAVVEFNTHSQKLFHQHGYVELQDIEARQVGALKKLVVISGHILEGRLPLNILVVNTMNERGLKRYRDCGVEHVRLAYDLVVGHQLDHRDLDDAILGDAGTGRFQIKENNWILKM